MDLKKLICNELYNSGVFKFGDFKLRNGETVNSYVDLLVIFNHPYVMKKITEMLCDLKKEKKIVCDSICGVTYAGVPFGSLVASDLEIPLIIRKKETLLTRGDRLIGNLVKGSRCLVVEEVISSGTSTLDVIKDLESFDIVVKDVIVVIDLGQGAVRSFTTLGYSVHALFTLTEISEILMSLKLISNSERMKLNSGFSTQLLSNGDYCENKKRKILLESRIKDTIAGSVAEKMLKSMIRKSSNLCVDVVVKDVPTLIKIGKTIGPYICILVIHLDIIDMEVRQFEVLKSVAKKHNFLIMDDCKLVFNPAVVELKIHKKFQHVDLISIHPLGNDKLLKVVEQCLGQDSGKGVFVVASPNIKDALVDKAYERNAVSLGMKYKEIVCGFIANTNSLFPSDFIHLMPNIQTTASVIHKSEKPFYRPDLLISHCGADSTIISLDAEKIDVNFVEQLNSLLWNGYVRRTTTVGYY